MSDKPDIDEGFDRLLSAFLRDETSRSGQDCPAPGVLAAYYEKRLDRSESEPIEAHLADCRACQEQMAALVRLDVEPPAGQAPRPEPVELTEPIGRAGPTTPVEQRRRWRWEWIAAPLAVAATAVIAVTITRRTAPELRVPPAASENGGSTAGGPAGAVRSDGIEGGRRAEAAGKEDREETARRATDEAAAANPEAERPSSDQAAGAPEPRAKAPPPLGLTGRAPAADVENPPRAAMAVAPGHSEGTADATAAMPETRVVVARSDPQISWRLRGASIERSEDGGGSWRRQSSGVASRLLAGSAPDGKVCWVAGNNGVVLRTTDGEHWRQVKPPTDHDLVEIVAQSESTAFVKDASGQRFLTRDGGRTWIRL